jgi:hypothetical protein
MIPGWSPLAYPLIPIEVPLPEAYEVSFQQGTPGGTQGAEEWRALHVGNTAVQFFAGNAGWGYRLYQNEVFGVVLLDAFNVQEFLVEPPCNPTPDPIFGGCDVTPETVLVIKAEPAAHNWEEC